MTDLTLIYTEENSDQDRREDKDLKRTSVDQTQTQQWNILWRIEETFRKRYIDIGEEEPNIKF